MSRYIFTFNRVQLKRLSIPSPSLFKKKLDMLSHLI
jgi:hypothetical protein